MYQFTRSSIPSVEDKLKKPIDFWMDNKGAIQLGINENEIKKSKHIEIRYRYVRELSAEDIVNLKHVTTDLNLSDIMTKGLNPKQFNFLLRQMKRFENFKH